MLHVAQWIVLQQYFEEFCDKPPLTSLASLADKLILIVFQT